jgi:hypothetical protein
MLQQIHIAMTSPEQSKIGSVLTIFVLFFIILSVVSFIAESVPSMKEYSTNCQNCKPVPKNEKNDLTIAARAAFKDECKDCEPQLLPVFDTIEAICIAVFTLEYVLRVGTSWALRSVLAITVGFFVIWFH